MTDRPAPTPPPGPVGKDDRDARRAAALRANLARRKAQKRARDSAANGPKEQG